jgi:hypothetical protein
MRLSKLLFIGVFCVCHAGFAREIQMMDSLPAGMIYPVPVGILFPGFNIAAGVNPAALPTAAQNTTAMQTMYSPPLQNGQTDSVFSSIASSNGTSAAGAGLIATYDPNNRAIGGEAFGGAGFKFDKVSLGIAVRDENVTSSQSPDVDLGFLFRSDKSGPCAGFVLYHTNTSAQLDFGLGFHKEHSYAFEVNFLLPQFNQWGLSSFNYTTVFSATIYSGIFGFYFRSVSSSQSFATLGILAQLSQKLSLIVEWTNPSILNTGFTINF